MHQHGAAYDVDLAQKNLARGVRDLLEGDYTLWEVRNRTHHLLKDPSSWVYAERAKMKTPWTWSEELMATLIDLYLQAHSKDGVKPPTFPRPFAADTTSKADARQRQKDTLRALYTGKVKPKWQQTPAR